MNVKQSQTTIEVIIIVAVIMILAIIVVTMIGNAPRLNSSANNGLDAQQLARLPIAIEGFSSTTTSITIYLFNHLGEYVNITAFSLDSTDILTSDIALSPYSRANITTNRFNASSLPLTLTYAFVRIGSNQTIVVDTNPYVMR